MLRALILLAPLGLILCATVLRAADDAKPARKLNVLVLTGGHGYDEKEFPKLFAGYDDLTPTITKQKVGDEAFQDTSAWKYDVIVLYNFNQKINETGQKNLLALLDKGVGLVVLHHAICGYQDWPEYRQITGARYYLKAETDAQGVEHKPSTWKDDVEYTIQVKDPSHAITAGMKDFTVHDEVYGGYTVFPDAKVLLTTTEKQNSPVLGWWKTYRGANVAYLQSGHGPNMYVDANYRALVKNAIRWAAK